MHGISGLLIKLYLSKFQAQTYEPLLVWVLLKSIITFVIITYFL